MLHSDTHGIAIHHGDALDVLAAFPDASVDAVVTDPPYGLADLPEAKVRTALAAWLAGDDAHVPEGSGGFMSMRWDSFVPPPALWRECLRVLKPGGHLLAFAAPRTQDLMGLSIRLSGFELRDSIHWAVACLDDQTEIMVNGTWRRWDNIRANDLALGYDPHHDEFSWQPVERVVTFPYSDTAYRLVGDHTDQLVTRGHRCVVERGGNYVFQFAEETAREREARVPVLEDVQRLLDALPLPHQGASGSEQDLLQGVREHVRQRSQHGEHSTECQPDVGVPGMWPPLPALTNQAASPQPGTDLFAEVQRAHGSRASDGAVGTHMVHTHVTGAKGGAIRALVGRRESRLEGWCHLHSDEGQLSGGQVRPVPTGVLGDGTQGRVGHGASASGGADHRATTGSQRGGSPRGPRHAEQRSIEPVAVRVPLGPHSVRASRFTTTDLVRVYPEHYDGIVWCITVPTGAFVARRNGKVFVTGNSGMPKGLNIAKGIDRAGGGDPAAWAVWLRAEREARGLTREQVAEQVGCTPASIRDWEEGRARHAGEPVEWITPSPEYRQRLVELFGFPSDARVEVSPEYDIRRFATELRKAREAAGLSRATFREWFPEYRAVTDNWERLDEGFRAPTAAVWSVLAERLGMDPDLFERCGLYRGDDLRAPVGGKADRRGDGTVLGLGHSGTEWSDVPTTVLATKWQGWNTTLRPAHEPIILARKPLQGSVVDTVLRYGTGGLNIDATRIAHAGSADRSESEGKNRHADYGTEPGGNYIYGDYSMLPPRGNYDAAKGRWPTNAHFSHGPNCVRIEDGAVKAITGTAAGRMAPDYQSNMYGGYTGNAEEYGAPTGYGTNGIEAVERWECQPDCPVADLDRQSAERTLDGDLGGGSRFFARGQMTHEDVQRSTIFLPKAGSDERPVVGAMRHVAVKPLDLMRWLVRMVTPPGGTVLDPFAGSGSTAEACLVEGFRCIAIEREADYLPLIEYRITRRRDPVAHVRLTRTEDAVPTLFD